MELSGTIEKWLLRVAVRKMVLSVLKLLLAFLASAKVAAILTQFGVTIDPVQLEAGLTVLGVAAMTALHDWVRLKTGLRFL